MKMSYDRQELAKKTFCHNIRFRGVERLEQIDNFDDMIGETLSLILLFMNFLYWV